MVDTLAEEAGHTILVLPPYHFELNPIELIWAFVKNYVASKNTSFKFKDLNPLFFEAIGKVDKQLWKKCCNHVIKEVEVNMWKLDDLMENSVEPLVINVGESESSDYDTT